MPAEPRARPVDPTFASGPPDHQPAPPEVPENLAEVIGPNATWVLVWVKGATETWQVSDVDAPGMGAVAVKVAPEPMGVADLGAEAARLAWLATADLGEGVVAPTVIATEGLASPRPDRAGAAATSAESATDDPDPAGPSAPSGWLVTAWLEGSRVSEPVVLSRPHDVLADTAGRALAAIHGALPVGACPFTATPADLAAAADAELARTDPDALPDPLRGTSIERARAWIADLTPAEPTGDDRVVAHGDPALGNLLIDRADGAVGVVDWTGLAVADRHRDLAVLVRSFIANLGPEHAWRLIDAYGAGQPDPLRIEWYSVIDQLVGR